MKIWKISGLQKTMIQIITWLMILCMSGSFAVSEGLSGENLHQEGLSWLEGMFVESVQDASDDSASAGSENASSHLRLSSPLIVYRMDTGTPFRVGLQDIYPDSFIKMTDILGNYNGSQAVMDVTVRDVNMMCALPDDDSELSEKFEIITGHMPALPDEVVIILNSSGELNPLSLCALGMADFSLLLTTGSAGVDYTADDLMNLEFRLLYNTSQYVKANGIWQEGDESDIRQALYDDGKSMALKVVGVVRARLNPEQDSSIYVEGIGYRSELNTLILNKLLESQIVKEQMSSQNTDVFTGMPFNPGWMDIRDLIKEMEEADDGRSESEKVSDLISMMETKGVLPKGMLPEWIQYALTLDVVESAIPPGTIMIEGTSYESNMKTLGICSDEGYGPLGDERYPEIHYYSMMNECDPSPDNESSQGNTYLQDAFSTGFVPELTGMNLDEAVLILNNQQLKYEIIYVSDEATEREIVKGQRPEAGIAAHEVDRVILMVSSGPAGAASD